MRASPGAAEETLTVCLHQTNAAATRKDLE